MNKHTSFQMRAKRLNMLPCYGILFLIVVLGYASRASAQTCTPAPVNLVSWWAGDGNALDSRSRNNGTLTGTTFVAGQNGQGFRFAPSGNLTADGSGSLDISGDKITIEASVKLENNVIHPMRDFSGFIGKNNFPTENYALLFESGLIGGTGPQLPANQWQVEYILTNSSDTRVHNQRTNVIVTVDGNYHHFALTYDGSGAPTSNVKIYIDGILQATNIANAQDQISGSLKSSPAAPLTISSVGTSNSVSIDEVSIYDRALSTSEIQSISNAGTAGKCKPTATVAPSGLVSWWPGDGNANDIQDGNQGTLMNGATFATGKVGQAFSFDGVDDVITVPASTNLGMTSAYTFDAWVNSIGSADLDRLIAARGDASANDIDVKINRPPAGNTLQILHNRTNGGTTEAVVFAAPPLNQLFHLAVTFDGTTVRAYYDGVEAALVSATNTITPPLYTNRGWLFGRTDHPAYGGLGRFVGILDEIEIYSRALSASEIQSIVNAGLAGKLKAATTSTGSNVSTNVGGDATITFPNVTTAGTTQQIPLDPAVLPALPAGFTSTGLAYDIATSATVSGSIVITFHLPAFSTQSQFSFLKVLHQEGSTFVDRTVSTNFAARTLTATVSSLSPFVIANGTSPTAVTLASFTATGFDDGRILLRWQTGFEADNLGFNIYREESGRHTLINPSLIAGSALIAGTRTVLSAGQSYVWADNGIAGCGLRIADCRKAKYWLEDVDLNGKSTWHGPVEVRYSGGKSPSLAESELLARIGWRQSLFINGLGSTPIQRAASMPRLSPELLASQTDLAAKPVVKLSVKQEGWYRVTQPELAAAGFDTKVNPRLLQVFVDGNQQPILVQGEQDGSFDAGDSVEFYGIGVDNPFTDSRVYFLAAGDQSGLRIKQVKSEGTPTTSRSFTYTVERRDRNIYFSGLRNGEKENFFGAVVGHNPVGQELTLVHLAQADSAQAQLEIALQGVNFGDHHVGVRINGVPVGELTFHGQAQGSARFAVANAILREGANIVQLTPLSGESDISLVDYLRVSYQHSYTADNDALKLTATGNQVVTIDGFTSKSVRVFDVTESNSPEELLGQVKQQKSGYAVMVAAPGQGQRELIAFTTEQRPASLTFNKTSNLRNGSASLVIITRAAFADALRPLVALRQKQGLSVSLVDIEDVYDEFSFGQKSPYAIRDFLSYAKSSWKKKPRFVLFAGDASYDPKNYLGFGDSDLVPTKLIDTDFMETSSDDWLSDLNGDGIADIATGRLPARTVEEVSRMVAKIVNYEQAAPSDEALLVADANEGFDFAQANDELRSLIPAGLRITQVNRGRLNAEMARSLLFEAIDRRQFLVNYAGHGSVNQWRGNLLTNDDALALRNDHLPMFVMMTCLNGYFHDPALDSLGESLMKAERGGAVAVWASSGMTLPADQALLNQELYRLLFNSVGATTIGEAVMRAKASVSNSDIRRTWVLLGDPAMRLR
jgi:Peptidase family C25/Concanavalin A-like lectin/glucanases superfamily